MILLLLALCSAQAAPPPGLPEIAQRAWIRAERAEAEGDPLEAARIYRSVWKIQGRIEGLLARAAALARAGELERALEELQEAGPDRDARVARARLLIEADRSREAAKILRGLTAGWGADPEIAQLRVQAELGVDPSGAMEPFALWLTLHEQELFEDEEVVRLAASLAHAWIERGEFERSRAVLDAASQTSSTVREALRSLYDELDLRQRAQLLAARPSLRLTAEASAGIRSATEALRQGEVRRAQRALSALPDAQLLHPEVLAVRARVALASGSPEQAEADLRLAETLDPLDPRWPVERATILDTHFGQRFDAEVFEALGRALRLRPENEEWRLQRVRVGARLGQDQVVREDLDWLSERSASAEVHRLAEDLARPRIEPAPIPPGNACPTGVEPEACAYFFLAFVLAQRDWPATVGAEQSDRDRAVRLIEQARTSAPGWVRPLNLQASLALGAPRPDAVTEAVALLRESLRIEPDQPDVYVFLGRLLRQGGDREGALEAWTRAVSSPSVGGAVAHLYLAEDAWGRWQIVAAQRHLDAYRAAAPSTTASLEARADRLAARLSGLRGGALAGGVFGALGLLVLATVLLGRLRRRPGVAELLEREPGAWRELAALASSTRHEVLRHHLGALGPIAESLERGDDRPARWLAERLDHPQGPLHRARERLAAVSSIASARGYPIDVAADPTFGPLVRLLDGLDVLRPSLRRGRGDIAWKLHALALLLEDEVEPKLAAFVRSAGRVVFDEGVIDRAIRAVRAEPTASWSEHVRFMIEPLPNDLTLRAEPEDVHEILCNVLRNAAAASAAAREDEIRVRVEIEEDPITAEEQIVVRIADRAPQPLTTSAIRSRPMEHGLGLTFDRVRRCGGSIAVEDEPGFAKAVVVRLPRVDPLTQEEG
ncbi:MAG: hypothetical protein EA397_11105 [Deltaproteobacteria bacterium]|nr:MAG: hypothetical protein EA397_11105 [Deltaproteobacteria bacterium]